MGVLKGWTMVRERAFWMCWETIYLIFRKTIVQRVAVVKLGVNDGDGNCFGDVKVKVGTDSEKHECDDSRTAG